MKRVFQHPPEPLTGKKYWRSLGEYSNTPEFREWLEREFPAGASEISEDEWSRRDFVKLMGASMALAGLGLTSCRRPEMHLVPFTKSAEWTIPGKFLYYATAMPRRTGASFGLSFWTCEWQFMQVWVLGKLECAATSTKLWQ